MKKPGGSFQKNRNHTADTDAETALHAQSDTKRRLYAKISPDFLVFGKRTGNPGSI
jgi:hypothetical protein